MKTDTWTAEDLAELFAKPLPVTDLEMSFAGAKEMERILPPYDALPEEFRRERHRYSPLVDEWFFSGLPKGTKFVPVDGIDGNQALRHVRAILGSFSPKHEHKSAGVAFLLSIWFSDIQKPQA